MPEHTNCFASLSLRFACYILQFAIFVFLITYDFTECFSLVCMPRISDCLSSSECSLICTVNYISLIFCILFELKLILYHAYSIYWPSKFWSIQKFPWNHRIKNCFFRSINILQRFCYYFCNFHLISASAIFFFLRIFIVFNNL